jgi:hypothetical protein
MPRPGTIVADICDFLGEKRGGATVEEIMRYLAGVRRTPVLRHSVRSAIQQHLGEKGQALFVRVGRGKYDLK